MTNKLEGLEIEMNGMGFKVIGVYICFLSLRSTYSGAAYLTQRKERSR